MTKNIALIGPMGAGKSFVGEQLAAHLNLPFIDIDREIEKSSGMTAHQIFRHDGEAAFRMLEEQALAKVLDLSEPAVIATGGGCVLAKSNRNKLAQNSWVVYLKVSGSVAIARCTDGERVRPLLQDENPLARWELISHERQVHYDSLANVSINTDETPAKELVAKIAAAWEGFGE